MPTISLSSVRQFIRMLSLKQKLLNLATLDYIIFDLDISMGHVV